MEQHDAVIYRVVLASAQSRIVQRSTAGPLESMGDVRERLEMHAGSLSGLDRSTIRAFLANHRIETPVPELGDSSIVWMSREEWRAFAGRRDGWAELAERYPGNAGVILLSRVGYSRDGAQALVYVTTACPLCGLRRVRAPGPRREGMDHRRQGAGLGFLRPACVAGRTPALSGCC